MTQETLQHFRKEPYALTINGHTVGEIYGDYYSTKRNPKDHWYRKGLGYPFSVHILEVLEAKGIRHVRIIEYGRDDKTVRVYQTSLFNLKNCKAFREKMQDEQKCLPLHLWKEISISEE